MAVSHPSTYQLGNPTTAYRAGLSVWGTLLAGAILALLGAYGLISFLANGARVARNSPLPVWLFVFGLGAAFLVIGYLQSSLRIQVFEQGFAYSKGSTTKVIRWDGIEAVSQQVIRQH